MTDEPKYETLAYSTPDGEVSFHRIPVREPKRAREPDPVPTIARGGETLAEALLRGARERRERELAAHRRREAEAAKPEHVRAEDDRAVRERIVRAFLEA